MIRCSVYVSEAKDPDLSGLLNDIGLNVFRKVTRLCIHGLFDKQAANNAVELAIKGSLLKEKPPEYKDGCARIRLAFNSVGNEQAISVLNAIKPNVRSMFIKTVVRQVLGPQVLMKYFLDENADAFFAEFVYVPVRTVSVTNVQTVQAINSETMAQMEQKNTNDTNNKINGFETESLSKKDASVPISDSNLESSSYKMDSIPISTPLPIEKSVESEGVSEDSSGDEDFDILSMLEAML